MLIVSTVNSSGVSETSETLSVGDHESLMSEDIPVVVASGIPDPAARPISLVRFLIALIAYLLDWWR